MNATLLQRPKFARDSRLVPLNAHPHSATRWLMHEPDMVDLQIDYIRNAVKNLKKYKAVDNL